MNKTPVASPCVNICQMHEPTGWCEGCLRTLDEISAWAGLDDDGRRAVWLQISRRRVQWRRLQAANTAAEPPCST